MAQIVSTLQEHLLFYKGFRVRRTPLLSSSRRISITEGVPRIHDLSYETRRWASIPPLPSPLVMPATTHAQAFPPITTPRSGKQLTVRIARTSAGLVRQVLEWLFIFPQKLQLEIAIGPPTRTVARLCMYVDPINHLAAITAEEICPAACLP